MARNFVGASSQLLLASSTPVTARPLTLACWFKPVATNVAYQFVTLDDGSISERFVITGSVTGTVRITAQHLAAGAIGATTATYSAGAWAHAGGVFTATTIIPYLNGVAPAATSSSTAPSGLVRVRIGSRADSGASFMNGDLAEVGVWNVALPAADMVVLARGVSPLLVRPDALVGYWPLRHGYSPEIDLMSTRTATVTGATIVAHPRVLLPRSSIILPPGFTPTPPPSGGGSTGAGGMRRRRRFEDQPLLYHPPIRRPWEKPNAEPIATPQTPPVVSPPKAAPPPVVVAPLDFSAERRDLAALRAELAGVQADLDDEADMLDYLDATE